MKRLNRLKAILLSLIVFLMREPLYPTRDTPAMTVTRDAHLVTGQTINIHVNGEIMTELIQPQTASKEEDAKDANEENEGSAGHLINRHRGV
jgi:hypothetical protein